MPYSDSNNTNIKREYFIGASTANGYISCCEDIFDKARKIFIIKGAPGTGKSYLMKKIADKAAADGYIPELFYCSSDANSLDAVYIPESGICITDGTSPHIRETDIPGSRDELIDLGEFWDSKKLEREHDKIAKLINEKKKLYSFVFDELGLCKKISDQRNALLASVADKDKLNSAAMRIIKSLGKASESRDIIYRQLDSIGMTGRSHLDTFRLLGEKHYYISGKYGSSSLFFDALANASKANGLPLWISRDPLSGMSVNALYFPSAKASFSIIGQEDVENDCVKIINMERFVSSKAIHEAKNRLKLLASFKNDLSAEIEKNFKNIKQLHFELERIYGEAMDFERVDKYSKKVIKTIFQ